MDSRDPPVLLPPIGDPSANARVEMQNVSVDFPIYHANARSLKRMLFNAASGRIAENQRHHVVVLALREVSFTLRPGDRLGLVGGNGAGKTTLLRTLAGIYEPVAGKSYVQGSIAALLDPNLGMNPELTGRENIMLRGLYAGLSKAAIAVLEEDVAAFSELGEFMDLPVRFYSSGMVVRLGFALSTAVHPQVLLMDEWFLAGDFTFMEKAKARLEKMVSKADILVLSSHMHEVILAWCNRVIWLEGGRIRADGAPEEVVAQYLGRPLA